MTKEEKQLVDISEQPIVFGVILVFLFLLFNSALSRTIIFISLRFVYL